MKKQNKEEFKKEFRCRVRGHNEYEEMRKHNGIIGLGGRWRRMYCFCKKCSVVFMEPEKFSDAE